MRAIKIEDLFIKNGFKPNEAQEESIKSVEGPIYLVAGPGSGKTRVLLWRTVNLIVFNNIKPEEIYLSTFTEKAAEQLKNGLLSLLALATEETGEHYDISSMYVGTVHSLCQKFIVDKRFENNLKKKLPIIMQELDQYFYVNNNKFLNTAQHNLNLPADYKEQIKAYMHLRSIGKNEIVKCLTSVFNRFSEECIDPVKIINDGQDDEVLIILAKLYKYYLESLKEEKREKIDLSLLQKFGYEVLCESRNSGKVFKHIIIDEYQDTNNIQEKIFFKLAKGSNNICVVGDDDQSLYRFRGATVENFVQFDKRCEDYLGVTAKKIKLNINYRSRKKIVEYYTNFIEKENWENTLYKGNYFRNIDKNIESSSTDNGMSVVTTIASKPIHVYKEIAEKVRELLDNKVISDPSEVAVLFTYLKGNENAKRLKEAFEEVDIKVYAPRAGRFFDNEEPMDMFGLLIYLFGMPDIDEKYNFGKNKEFNDWIEQCYNKACKLIGEDEKLEEFVGSINRELQELSNDYIIINNYMMENNLDYNNLLSIVSFRELKKYLIASLSETGKREINKKSLERIITKKLDEGVELTYNWVITRINSLDWNLLDIFYELCGFKRFKMIFDNAEKGIDEGGIYNLSNITNYIHFFIENNFGLITGRALVEEFFIRSFVTSYLGALYKREEGECEINDEPIPKGRVSFLTIHQSKGLEFPVVILGAIPPVKSVPNKLEEMVRPFLSGQFEPLDRISEFDRMRSYYVALSRAENLLILPHFKGPGQRIHQYFKDDLESGRIPLLGNLDINLIPKVRAKNDDVTKVYSYTSDYLAYNDCPRKYMIYRKYNFVPARTTITFFGNLVHKTLEDIHNYYIGLRGEN